MNGKIYKITNTIDGKIYIGKTTKSIKERFQEHIKTSRKESYQHKSYLYNAMRKYGVDKFSIEEVEDVETNDLDDRERYWIKILNTTDINVGYNIHEGGCGGKTFVGEYIPNENQLKGLEYGRHLPASETLKKQLSERRTNIIVSDETREKLRQNQSGRKMSDECKEKHRKYMTGENNPNYGGLSNKTKEKIRQASSGRKHIHKGNINKNVKLEELDRYYSDGWVDGYVY